jgi:hypothetical protein
MVSDKINIVGIIIKYCVEEIQTSNSKRSNLWRYNHYVL